MNSELPVALVTGANRGIGKEVCRQLADQGYMVLLTGRSLPKVIEAVVELGRHNIVPGRLDVADQKSITAYQSQVARVFKRVDALINNAAIHYDSWQRAVSADFGIVQEAVETNVYGPWRVCQAFLPLLRKSPHPRIVNVSSGSGALSSMGGGTPAYSLSKAGLNALTRMLAAELRTDGVLVNAVCPGWVATDMGGSGGRPVAEGAAGILWAVNLGDNGPTGGFFRDGSPIKW